MQYTRIPEDTFEKLQLNAGILVDDFTPASGTIGNLMGATTGGITFAVNPTYQDLARTLTMHRLILCNSSGLSALTRQ